MIPKESDVLYLRMDGNGISPCEADLDHGPSVDRRISYSSLMLVASGQHLLVSSFRGSRGMCSEPSACDILLMPSREWSLSMMFMVQGSRGIRSCWFAGLELTES